MGVCIVTGASRGIGRETVKALAKRPEITTLVLIARDEQALYSLKEEIGLHVEVHCIPFDIRESEKLKEIIESIGKRYGRIDYLLNIAGYASPHSLIDTSDENWQLTYKINVEAPFILCREVVLWMKSQGGVIVNIASTAGMTSRPGWVAYASSKAALIHLSQTLSDELKEYGIRVYCLSPGRCATDLRKVLAPDEDASRIMQPSHVAKVITNLLFESEGCLDGQNIIVRKPV